MVSVRNKKWRFVLLQGGVKGGLVHDLNNYLEENNCCDTKQSGLSETQIQYFLQLEMPNHVEGSEKKQRTIEKYIRGGLCRGIDTLEECTIMSWTAMNP